MVWPAIIAGAASLAGSIGSGLIGAGAAGAANAANMQFAREQLEWQKTLATQGIRLRVYDAQQAGIHPLFALGNPGMSFSPVSAGQQPDTSWSRALSQSGQDISRAVLAAADRGERQQAELMRWNAVQNAGLQTQGTALQNEYTQSMIDLNRARLAQMQGGQVGPPLPGPAGSGVPGFSGQQFEIKPTELGASQGGAGTGPVGAGPAGAYIEYKHTGSGLTPVPAKELQLDDLNIFTDPRAATWVANAYSGSSSARPDMEKMARAFPGATGMWWVGYEWRPLYEGSYSPIDRYRMWKDRMMSYTFSSGAAGRGGFDKFQISPRYGGPK